MWYVTMQALCLGCRQPTKQTRTRIIADIQASCLQAIDDDLEAIWVMRLCCDGVPDCHDSSLPPPPAHAHTQRFTGIGNALWQVVARRQHAAWIPGQDSEQLLEGLLCHFAITLEFE